MSWIFAYGSLMWDPEFECEERVMGTLDGYHREFNKKSTRGWGTRDAPGPVLGLEEGRRCVGLALRLAHADSDATIATIDEREGPSYERNVETIELVDGREVEAIVWINRRNFTYIGEKSLDERARMVIEAEGRNGAAKEYVLETRRMLNELGVEDPFVEEFAEKVIDYSD